MEIARFEPGLAGFEIGNFGSAVRSTRRGVRDEPVRYITSHSW
jgi:hypothetical protein